MEREKEFEELIKKSVIKHPLYIEITKVLGRALALSAMLQLRGDEELSLEVYAIVDDLLDNCTHHIFQALKKIDQYTEELGIDLG